MKDDSVNSTINQDKLSNLKSKKEKIEENEHSLRDPGENIGILTYI